MHLFITVLEAVVVYIRLTFEVRVNFPLHLLLARMGIPIPRVCVFVVSIIDLIARLVNSLNLAWLKRFIGSACACEFDPLVVLQFI